MSFLKENRFVSWLYATFLLLLLLCAFPLQLVQAEQAPTKGELTSSQPVYRIPIQQTIESGLQSFLDRAMNEAEEAGAKAIILEINTLGGRVDSAETIGERIRSSKVTTIAYIKGKAVSAGSYIALNADQIVMQPGSSIGSAAVVTMTGVRVDDAKIISHWAGVMRAAAEMNGRNPQVAEGMVDESIVVTMPEIERTKQKGEIIALTADEALKVGYADHIATDLGSVLEFIGAQGHPIVQIEPSIAEKLARVLTHPLVMTLLMLIGIAGIAIEIFVPGFGIPGILGIAAFILYFFGNYAAGFAGIEHVVLFVVGMILVVIEMFVPGFGIFGILGTISLIVGVVLAAYDTGNAIISLSIAFVVAIIVVAIVIKYFKHKGVWNRFILKDELKSEFGYISTPSKTHLLHLSGVTVTALRPAGIALVADERVDVVTSGEFIEAGRKIIVVIVEGTRVVVREVLE